MRKKSASGRALLTYNYDLNGNLIHQKDVTGKVTEYTYNALDLIEKVTDNGIIIAEYSYYPDGTTRSLKNGNLYTEYTFDADKNLTGLKTHLGTEVLTDNHYTYDRNGNRTEKRQLNGSTHYTYDARNQLTKVQYPTYTEELYYDKTGNRTKRTAKGIEERYKYDPRNRLTEYTKGGIKTEFLYDNAGNLLRDDKAKYTYDAFNRTEKVETFDGHVQINRYDAEGFRHELEEDGKLVQFIFRGDEIVGEEKDSNIIRYIRGYDLVASDAESARTYYHYASDEMGSITHVVEEDQIRNHYEYDVWGNATTCEETIENRFRFNGQQYDPITQQYYLRARFYNSVIGRFTQEDTYRGDGLNLYAYCANNPVYYVDPSGNESDCWRKQSANKKAKVQDKNDQSKAKKKTTLDETGKSRNRPDSPKANTPNNKSKAVNKYPPRTPLAQEECQRVVDMGNKIKREDLIIKAYQETRDTPFSPTTCVFVHQNGTVSVGISGYYEGTRYSRHYANELQKALNKEAGWKKYTVCATTAQKLMKNTPKQIRGGSKPGMCAEPKAATAAHKNESPIVGMDVRYYTSEGEVPHRLFEGSNQMDQCNTCKYYEEVIMKYANEKPKKNL